MVAAAKVFFMLILSSHDAVLVIVIAWSAKLPPLGSPVKGHAGGSKLNL
jgi:hypothetical protein